MIRRAAAALAPLVGQVGISLSNLLIGLLLVRYAATEEYGLYVLGFSMAMFMVGVQDALVSVPVMVRAGAFNGAARARYLRWNRRALYSTVVAIGIFLAVAAGATMAAGASEPSPGFVLALLFAAAFWIAWDYQRGEALALRRRRALLRMDLGYLAAVSCAMLALYHWRSLSAVSMLSAVALGSLVAAALGLGGTRPMSAHVAAVSRASRLWWRRGRYSLLTGLVSWVQSQGYIYLCASLLGLESLARIAAARLLFAPLATLLAAWVKATTTRTAERCRRGEGDAVVRDLLVAMAGFVTLAALWCGAILWFEGFLSAEIFKGKYPDMTMLIVAWGFGFAANATRTIWHIGLRATAQFRQLARLAALGAIVSVLGSLAGIHWLGEGGAVAGLAVAEALVALMAALFFRTRVAGSQ